MDGRTAARIVDTECAKRDIAKSQFHAYTGVSSATLSQWRNGIYDPTPDKLAAIEKFLNISFADYEKSEQLQGLRDDLRILLRSASDLPPSSVYALIAQIEKEKERSVLPD